ncbi:MAG: tRNA adenosine(34) deaminase TadA [Sutterellaceae bacterium]|nr:tRNA adenosine(34) deaminase TadA [Sutterellaceae bacterium]MDY2867497.1 tRNA adenosine(34) deaminase TadA [Mesosutterella sp.]
MEEPLPYPERVEKADAERFLELSIRKGWPVAALRTAPAADRHAVLAVFALYAAEAEKAGKRGSDGAVRFLENAGSFLKGTVGDLLALARETAWIDGEGRLNAFISPGLSTGRVEAEIEFAEDLRSKRRTEARAALQKKNREVNSKPSGIVPEESGDEAFMREALSEAKQAGKEGEVPVGAVLVMGGKIIGRGRNAPIRLHDPTAHAEIRAIREAAERLGNYRLEGSTLYVTLEPCPMCTGAIAEARLERVVFGASDERKGALGGAVNLGSSPAVQRSILVTKGVLAEESLALLRDFFRRKRKGE